MSGGRVELDTFSTLLESVYESAFDPEQWQVFLRGLAQALNAKSGMFRVIDERIPAVRANIHYNLDPALQEAHRQYYVSQDIFIKALRHHPVGFCVPGEHYLSLREVQRTEFFADYLQPQDSYHVCGGLAMRNEEFTIKFGLQRDKHTGPFSRADADFIRRFIPHIQRAARLDHLLGMARQEVAVFEDALESLAVGVVLLDEEGRIFHANHKAVDLLDNRRGMVNLQGRLTATEPADARPLRDALAAVLGRARLNGPPVPETLLLTPAPGEPQMLVVASPVPPGQPGFHGPWPQASVAVFVSNLTEAGMLSHELLQRLYGLTPREARLAVALARGWSLGELSEEWCITRETLRTHLKRVLGKTGTNRQAALVRLLSGNPWSLASQPPVEETGE